MHLTPSHLTVLAVSSLALSSISLAGPVVIDFEDLDEGFYGEPFSHMGVTYYDLNNVSGIFPNGDPFGPEPTDEVVIEDATLFYNDFPGWGSPVNVLTFGNAYIPGENLSLGRLSTVMMDLEAPANSVAMDVGYYENGPWGGIVFHLDAVMDGQVVGEDSFTIADGGGRDNGAVAELAVSGVVFDQLHFYATFGEEYSLPRVIVDDFTLNFVGGGPELTIDGTCPGPMRLNVVGSTANEPVAFIYARGTGSIIIPTGPCAGTELGLNGTARLVGTTRADANGDATFGGNAPAAACGGFVQALDVAGCQPSNVAPL